MKPNLAKLTRPDGYRPGYYTAKHPTRGNLTFETWVIDLWTAGTLSDPFLADPLNEAISITPRG